MTPFVVLFIVFVLVTAGNKRLYHLVDLVFEGLGRVLLFLKMDFIDPITISLKGWEGQIREGLAYRVSDEGGDGWSGWNVLSPIINFVLFVVLAIGELYLASLRFGALFGVSGESVSISTGALQILSGLLLAACVTVWAFVAFDVSSMSPVKRPFVEGHTGLRRVAYLGFSLSLLITGMFFLWGQGQIEGAQIQGLAQAFIFLFGILLAGAVAFSGWSLIVAPAALLLIVVLLVRKVGFLIRLVITAAMHVLHYLHQVAAYLMELLVRFCVAFWNWLVDFRFISALGLDPIDLTAEERKITLPTFPEPEPELKPEPEKQQEIVLPRVTLRRRDKGKWVGVWQQVVNLLQSGNLKVDSYYGAKTQGQTKAFQQLFGIEDTGIVREDTWKRAEDVLNQVTDHGGGKDKLSSLDL